MVKVGDRKTVPLGGRNKLLFGWALDPELKLPLRSHAARPRA